MFRYSHPKMISTMKLRSLTAMLALVLASLVILHPGALRANVRLPKIFSDRMVLQHDRPIPVWGWAAPGESVTAKIGDRAVAAKADENGVWRVTLPTMAAGGPFALTVTGQNTITLRDVLVGEVWLSHRAVQHGIAACQHAVCPARHSQGR